MFSPAGKGKYTYRKHYVNVHLQYTAVCDVSYLIFTHISLASFLCDMDKQNSPRCDAAERGRPSGALLFAYLIFIEK